MQSEETRLHLQDAHKRVMSIAAVQKQLHASGVGGSIEIAPYLSRLCETLADSMIGDSRPISLKVVGEGGSATSRQAESLGLIVTELVMNALKHAFPDEKTEGRIIVAYDMAGTNWKLSVSDNGIGKPEGGSPRENPGSAPASSRRWRSNSMPRSKPRPAPRARPCRSPTPRSRKRQSSRLNGDYSLARRSTGQRRALHVRARRGRNR